MPPPRTIQQTSLISCCECSGVDGVLNFTGYTYSKQWRLCKSMEPAYVGRLINYPFIFTLGSTFLKVKVFVYSFCESELFMDHVGYVNSFQCQMRHWASTPYQTPQTFMRSGSLGRLVHQLVHGACRRRET